MENKSNTQPETTSRYSKPQRIGALVCVILIVLIYIVALIASFFSSEAGKTIARIAIGCTLVLPLLTWAYIWMIGKLTHRHTIADFDLLGIPTNHEGETVNTENTNQK